MVGAEEFGLPLDEPPAETLKQRIAGSRNHVPLKPADQSPVWWICARGRPA